MPVVNKFNVFSFVQNCAHKSPVFIFAFADVFSIKLYFKILIHFWDGCEK